MIASIINRSVITIPSNTIYGTLFAVSFIALDKNTIDNIPSATSAQIRQQTNMPKYTPAQASIWIP